MANLHAVYHPSDEASIYFTLATVTASAVQTVGVRKIIQIVADQPINIIFGPNASVHTATATTGMRIPPNFPVLLETSDNSGFASIFNPSASTANICIAYLSRS